MPPDSTAAHNMVDVLAALMSDSRLRKDFELNAQECLSRWNLREAERLILLQLRPDQLHTHGVLLIRKRLREVAKWIPLSVHALGSEAYVLFAQYAEQVWPQTHRRHEQDAARFCDYLKTHGYPFNKSEWNRMQFIISHRRYAWALVSDANVRGKKTPALQFMYRMGQERREWRFYIKV